MASLVRLGPGEDSVGKCHVVPTAGSTGAGGALHGPGVGDGGCRGRERVILPQARMCW